MIPQLFEKWVDKPTNSFHRVPLVMHGNFNEIHKMDFSNNHLGINSGVGKLIKERVYYIEENCSQKLWNSRLFIFYIILKFDYLRFIFLLKCFLVLFITPNFII